MFLKKTISKGKTYVSIAETYRDKGKIKHRILLNLGRIDKLLADDSLRHFLQSINNLIDDNKSVEFKSMLEEERFNWGAAAVYKHIWDSLALDDILNKTIKNENIRFDLKNVVFLTVVAKLQGVSSKLELHSAQGKFYGIKKVSLNNIYRSLDLLADSKEAIEEELKNKNFSKYRSSLAIYDLAPLYFDEAYPSQNTKERKIIFGLLVNECGLPIGFDLYFNNTFTTDCLEKTLSNFDRRFEEKEIIIITDRDLNCESALKIAEYTLDYIVLCKFDNLKEPCKKRVCKISNCRYANSNCRCKGQCCSFRHFDAIPYRDSCGNERPELLEKMFYGIWSPIKFQNQQTDAKSDKQSIFMNNELFNMERLFSIFKTELTISTVRHWTPKKIKGHFMVCFIAFLLQRTLEMKLAEHQLSYSTEDIKNILSKLEVSVINMDGKKYFLQPKIAPAGKEILRALKVKTPVNLLSAKQKSSDNLFS